MCDQRKIYTKLTSSILRHATGHFHDQGFMQLMPVMLSSVTDPLGPDPGSSVLKSGEIEYLEQKLTLTQSMILHKQIALKEGLEKLFIVSPNVRLEHPKRGSSGKHLFEFSQLDFEIAEAKMDDIFSLMEGYLSSLGEFLGEEFSRELETLHRKLPDLSGPYPRHTTQDLQDKYGEDWEIPASMDAKKPFWAISHKREFYDREDPEKPGHYLNYDLIYPQGFGEGLSGAEREYEFDQIVRRIDRDGLDKKRYTPYLELAKDGLIPSAGGGFGIERLIRFVSGAKHVGDVQFFRRVPGEPVTV
jgi:asparaginyl-tRNA synthetase